MYIRTQNKLRRQEAPWYPYIRIYYHHLLTYRKVMTRLLQWILRQNTEAILIMNTSNTNDCNELHLIIWFIVEKDAVISTNPHKERQPRSLTFEHEQPPLIKVGVLVCTKRDVSIRFKGYNIIRPEISCNKWRYGDSVKHATAYNNETKFSCQFSHTVSHTVSNVQAWKLWTFIETLWNGMLRNSFICWGLSVGCA